MKLLLVKVINGKREILLINPILWSPKRTGLSDMGYTVLTTVNTVFWDVMPCGFVDWY
jgi:hypothetical protein